MLSAYWQPMSELSRLRSEMDRVFGRYGDGHSRGEAQQFPPLNIWEDDETLFVEAELPGFELDDLEIYVTGENLLSISGERKQPAHEQGAWHRLERAFGKFRRTFDLPSDVNSDAVSATFTHGVLTLAMPKSEEVKPRRIKVTAK
jgi:HSP20 family protein